jgi:hypothetical protein
MLSTLMFHEVLWFVMFLLLSIWDSPAFSEVCIWLQSSAVTF